MSLSFRNRDVCLYHFAELSSTNLFLKSVPTDKLQPSLCIADLQTCGYGQQQRAWHSDSTSITFSLLLPFDLTIDKLVSISPFTGICVVQFLSQYFNQSCYVKWPNDIFSSKGKLGGILIESKGVYNDQHWLVLGVGINLGKVNSLYDGYNADALAPVDNKYEFINALAANLLFHFESFTECSFQQMLGEWQVYDYFNIDELVNVQTADGVAQAYYLGVAADAGLFLRFVGESESQRFVSGAVSLRKVN